MEEFPPNDREIGVGSLDFGKDISVTDERIVLAFLMARRPGHSILRENTLEN